MKLRCTIIAFMMLFAAYNLTAAYRSVVVNLRDGSSVAIEMETDLKANLSENALEFSCAKGQVTIPIQDVHFWNFSNAEPTPDFWTGIEEATADNVIVKYTTDSIHLGGLKAGVPVSLVSLNGLVCKSTKADASGEVAIDTSDFPEGAYILNYGFHSIKFFMTR